MDEGKVPNNLRSDQSNEDRVFDLTLTLAHPMFNTLSATEYRAIQKMTLRDLSRTQLAREEGVDIQTIDSRLRRACDNLGFSSTKIMLRELLIAYGRAQERLNIA